METILSTEFKTEALIHRGSVKNIYKTSRENELLFDFSDRFSVFDWGEMPDALEGKGKVLAKWGNYFFRLLQRPEAWKNWQPRTSLEPYCEEVLQNLRKNGLSNHYVPTSKEELESGRMLVKEVHVPKVPFNNGKYNYQAYHSFPTNTLVPLEIIFRFGVPTGSSFFKRTGDKDYLRSLGLHEAPKEGNWLPKPIIEFSTKLEATDRYLSYEEAQSISGLGHLEFAKLYALNLLTALFLKDFFNRIKIDLWDGKFEWAFGERINDTSREFLLVDSIGPDELRLSYKDCKLSKEFLRSFYRGSEWLKGVESAKKMAEERQTKEWKKIAKEELSLNPMELSATYKDAALELYHTLGLIIPSDEKELGVDQIKVALDALNTKMQNLS